MIQLRIKTHPQPLLLKREGEKNRVHFRKCFPLSFQERGIGGEFSDQEKRKCGVLLKTLIDEVYHRH